MESLESKTLLAGDVTASLAGGDLTIEGDRQANGLLVQIVAEERAQTQLVQDGTTSVFLDLALLELAANLTLSSLESSGTPFSDDFQVGFPIEETSTFRFGTAAGFAPVEGLITHTGTVGFNNDSIVVGDFAIGFDASRAGGAASGFFVEDTVSNLGILFDVGVPDTANFSDPELTIATPDLLVSDNFAQLLGDSSLAGADVGDARIDALAEAFKELQVDSGTTSVFLDLPLLDTAANLQLSSVDSKGEPFSDDFQVGFPITPTGDFEYSTTAGFQPLSGEITHRGTVGFNADSIIVGDFVIGFDASRVDGMRSGFFVEDTFSGLGVLFDVGIPGGLSSTDSSLIIEDADLLVSENFASILGDPALAGADVGNARVDATTIHAADEFIIVQGLRQYGRPTTVNGERFQRFSADDVHNVSIDTQRGSDRLIVRHLRLTGGLTVELGSGFYDTAYLSGLDIGGLTRLSGGRGWDRIIVQHSFLSDAHIDTGSGSDALHVVDSAFANLGIETRQGWDSVKLAHSHVRQDLSADLGGGWDRLGILRSNILGRANLDGGRGFFDRLDSISSQYGSLHQSHFELVRIH